jgi:hypothetical protein
MPILPNEHIVSPGECRYPRLEVRKEVLLLYRARGGLACNGLNYRKKVFRAMVAVGTRVTSRPPPRSVRAR